MKRLFLLLAALTAGTYCANSGWFDVAQRPAKETAPARSASRELVCDPEVEPPVTILLCRGAEGGFDPSDPNGQA